MNNTGKRLSRLAIAAACGCVPLTAHAAKAATTTTHHTTAPRAHAAPRAAAPAADPTTPYYGNAKTGVEVSSNPGQYPLFDDAGIDGTESDPALGGFTIAGTTDDAAYGGRCTTRGLQTTFSFYGGDGNCQMDSGDGTTTFPVPASDGSVDNFDFAVDSSPPGWILDPDHPSRPDATGLDQTEEVDACPPATAGVDSCTTQGGASVPDFDVIGLWRTLQVQVTSQVTGQPLTGVDVRLACTAPDTVTDEPDGYACPTSIPDVTTDDNGTATFSGLFLPGDSITLNTVDGLAVPPYEQASLTTTVPSPVTADTTTGPEISAAAQAAVVLDLDPTGPLPPATGTTPEDGSVQVTGLGADSGFGDLTVNGVGQPDHGTATLNPDGSVTYVPANGYVGTDTFTYTAAGTPQRVTDARTAAATGGTGTVTVTVTPVPPTAQPTTTTTAEATPVAVDLTPLVAGPAGGTNTITSTGAAGHGTVHLSSGTATYTPAANFTGTDSFTYTVTNSNGLTASSTVGVTVTAAAPTTTTTTTTTPPAATTTTVPDPTTTPGTTTPGTVDTTVTTGSTTTTSSGNLAFTGADVLSTAASGGLLVGVGAALVRISRRRRRKP